MRIARGVWNVIEKRSRFSRSDCVKHNEIAENEPESMKNVTVNDILSGLTVDGI